MLFFLVLFYNRWYKPNRLFDYVEINQMYLFKSKHNNELISEQNIQVGPKATTTANMFCFHTTLCFIFLNLQCIMYTLFRRML